MTRYAILIGAADLSDGIQKSLVEFKDFLTSAAGGFWREDEIMVCEPLEWSFVQLLQARLAKYDFVLVYHCRFSRGEADSDWSGKLRSVTDGGQGVFISDVCDEVVSAEAIGYERAMTAEYKVESTAHDLQNASVSRAERGCQCVADVQHTVQ